MTSKFTASEKESRRRSDKLKQHMKDHVLKEGLVCQEPHTGKLNALKKHDKPFSILVVGHVVAPNEEHESVNMEKRSRHVVGIPTNPHMRGTLYTLQLLFCKEPNDKDLDITIDGETENILHAFSLTNFILCPEEKDIRLCGEHLEATIKILEPQIIILQGISSYGYFSEKGLSLNSENPKPFEFRLLPNGDPILVLPLRHPYQPNEKNYGDPLTDDTGDRTRKNLEEYVCPAIKELLSKYEDIWGK